MNGSTLKPHKHMGHYAREAQSFIQSTSTSNGLLILSKCSPGMFMKP